MSYQVHKQYVDLESGFHVVELRDERGHKHIAQIALAGETCPACGRLTPKDNLGELNPSALIGEVNADRNLEQRNMVEYARKHGISIK